MNITYKHFEILKELFQIQDNSFLNKVLDLVKEHRSKNEVTAVIEDEEIAELHRMAQQPMLDHILLEQIIEEQGFTNKGFSEALNSVDDDLFADETLEEMLKDLN
jgi:hypothetical protein